MKQILTFVGPNKQFNEECGTLVKVQIDNSLELGWRPEDIILATNFDYEYRGVKATQVGDCYCQIFAPATKIYAILALFNKGVINDGLYWYHDFDTYQFNPITEEELNLNDFDLGLPNYGRRPRLCSASMFFKKEAKDIFKKVKQQVDFRQINEERAIMNIINMNPETFGKRIKMINTSYAFHRFNILTIWPNMVKPIKAAHFHPTPDKFDFYLYGQNKLNMQLLPERLATIFKTYGYC